MKSARVEQKGEKGKGVISSLSKRHVEDVKYVQRELWIKHQARFEKERFLLIKDYEDAPHFTF